MILLSLLEAISQIGTRVNGALRPTQQRRFSAFSEGVGALGERAVDPRMGIHEMSSRRMWPIAPRPLGEIGAAKVVIAAPPITKRA
jgi:hypothetical protein